MLTRKVANYAFLSADRYPSKGGSFLEAPFCLFFPVPKNLFQEQVLLRIPGSFCLRLVCRSYEPENPENLTYSREGCFYFREEKEWILEAQCHMTTSDGTYHNTYFVRLPLSAPFAQSGELGFWFDGTWLRFMKDGYVLNENSGLDRFADPIGIPEYAPGWEDSFRAEAADVVTVSYEEHTEPGNADFYSPREWNAFAGDVMNYYHDGTYHLIYLRDRRHHGSRNGEGGHDIHQLTSRDLIHWQEQEPVAVIDAPWKTYGTGTMLFHKGKYYMVYGYHTERYYGTTPQVEPGLEENSRTFPLSDGKELLQQGKLPAGASYSVSEDGIHFEPSYMLFHPGRNPSTYVTPEGKLKLFAGYMGAGIWESNGFDEPFCQTGEDFSFVERSVMQNSTECPCAFVWNGYRYLVIGFTGYYRSLTPGGGYVDMAGKEEIYDGLGVPMVSRFGQDRYLMAGWLNGIGWGSVIVHRELIQEEQGRLGMKWVPEMVPETQEENLLENSPLCQSALESGESYLLEMMLDPQSASRGGIQLISGDAAVELQMDFKKKRIQFSEATPHTLAPSLPTAYEVMVQKGENANWRTEKIAYSTRDFCLGGIEGMEGIFPLRLLIRVSRKMRSTVLDAEIAGRRTILSVRKDFLPERICTCLEDGGQLREMSLKKLKHNVM